MRLPAFAVLLAMLALVMLPVVARAPHVPPRVALDVPAGSDTPALTLWAWERPEDLRFLRSTGIGIAPLIATITLHGNDLQLSPRRQPLELPADAPVTAVVRLELDATRLPALSREQGTRLATMMVSLASAGTFRTLQVDFDAPRSARPFYRRLLADLRAALPARARLSMTALASWCLGDPWLDDLPVDEVVPMAFRMGADARGVRQHLAAGRDFQPVCRSAIGVATDEPLAPFPADRHRYVFAASAWTPDRVRALYGVDLP
jgi:hypothetical protein